MSIEPDPSVSYLDKETKDARDEEMTRRSQRTPSAALSAFRWFVCQASRPAHALFEQLRRREPLRLAALDQAERRRVRDRVAVEDEDVLRPRDAERDEITMFEAQRHEVVRVAPSRASSGDLLGGQTYWVVGT